MRPIDVIRIILVGILAAIVFTPPILVGWTVPMLHRRKIFYFPWLIFARGTCAICRIDMHVKGKEHIKRDSYLGKLYISNHQSALDITLLVANYPLPFLTKKENLYLPFIGLAGLLAGSIAFDRDSGSERRKVLEKIVDRAKNHTALYIFPEGTRSKTGELQKKVFPALLRMAWRAGLEVVPIALHGSYLVVGHKAPPGGRYPVFIEIGEPIAANKFDNDKVFANYCWEQVIKQHESVSAEFAELEAVTSKKVISAES
ncbi:MAG: 1-acyl-sn-glycerol-3-phosphate acyltransferase [Blastocatellia bacterium]|nr:1-acyl-sn-glycerol-3-phosphate acyltransferase [Blastocatellia bacterium]MBL8194243.1 1-acyl-sn-glycerol-3-phosphate acyltransferase [Blastocatellia bacterium]MBN8721658.1 1-acyl-sn-glycerol-3-phosphate acyltransferase [Acidobacteriota bacterium]